MDFFAVNLTTHLLDQQQGRECPVTLWPHMNPLVQSLAWVMAEPKADHSCPDIPQLASGFWANTDSPQCPQLTVSHINTEGSSCTLRHVHEDLMTRPRQQPNNPLTVTRHLPPVSVIDFAVSAVVFLHIPERTFGIFLADPRWETSSDSIEQATSLHFHCHLSPSLWHSLSVIIALFQTQNYHATRHAGALCEAKSTAEIFVHNRCLVTQQQKGAITSCGNECRNITGYGRTMCRQ